MGLDVNAVTKFKVVDSPSEDQKEDLDCIFQPEGFERHLGEDLINGMFVDVVECGEGDYHSGYGGHSHFREFLAELAGYPKLESPKPSYSDEDYDNKSYHHRFPFINGMYSIDDLTINHDFVALIHFSDCEGVICNALCKVLDSAFDKHMSKASESDWFAKYKDMAICVKEAANSGGYLDFH